MSYLTQARIRSGFIANLLAGWLSGQKCEILSQQVKIFLAWVKIRGWRFLRLNVVGWQPRWTPAAPQTSTQWETIGLLNF